MTKYFLEGSPSPITGQSSSMLGLSNRLLLASEDLGISQKLEQKGKEFNGTVLSLRGRDLANAVLDRVDLRHVDFSAANLIGTSLRYSNLERSHFDCATTIHPSRASSYKFRDCADLRGARFGGANLRAVTMLGAKVDGAVFDRADMRGASMRYASAIGARMVETHLEGANLEQSNFTGLIADQAVMQGASLVGARFRAASLYRAHLEGSVLHEVDFIGANLGLAQLQGALLSKARLRGTNFQRAWVYRVSCADGIALYNCDSTELKQSTYSSIFIEAAIGLEERKEISDISGQIESVISNLPFEEAKKFVRARLDVLRPEARSKDDDASDENFWNRDSRASNMKSHLEERARTLKLLLCSPATYIGSVQLILQDVNNSAGSELYQGSTNNCPTLGRLQGEERTDLLRLLSTLGGPPDDKDFEAESISDAK